MGIFAKKRITLVFVSIFITLTFSKQSSKKSPKYESLEPTGRRVLLHAAPGCGGSIFLFLLAQNHDTVAFPNLRVPPPLVADLSDISKESDIMLKVTMGDSNTSLAEAIENFQPDIKILLVRHPASLAQILQPGGDPYRQTTKKSRPGDLMPRQVILERLEWTWSMSAFQWDAIILYEELLFNSAVIRQKLKGAGFTDEVIDKMDRMKRTKKDLERFNGKASRWSRKQRTPSKHAREINKDGILGWDFGGVSRSSTSQLAKMRQEFPNQFPSAPYRIMAKKFCPTLSKYYAEHHPELEATSSEGGGGGSATGSEWLLAMRRFHLLIDDRATIFKTSASITSNQINERGSPHHTPLRERWIVMTMASNNWVQTGILFNWIASLHRIEIENYVVISLDEAAHEALSAMSVASFFHEVHDEKDVILAVDKASIRSYQSNLIIYKWKLVAASLKRGVSVLLSDADIVFLRDLRPLFASSQSHIVSGRGLSKGLIIRTPVLLLRSSVEVLHLLPRFIAALGHFKSDEIALNKIVSGLVGWAEPPLKPEARDHFIEGKTIRSVATSQGALFDTLSGSLEGSSSSLKGPLDASLRFTLAPNRIFRLYDCYKGFPLETAFLMHCGNESRPNFHNDLLVMNRAGRLVEPLRPKWTSGSPTNTGDATRDRLHELGLWMLSPKWRQQFDLIQGRMNRHVPGESHTFLWDQFRGWIRDNTVWSLPEKPETQSQIYGAARKSSPSSSKSRNVVSAHNIKRNCRYTAPSPEDAPFVLPAIKCTT